MMFKEWLMKEKGFTNESARDVVSRIKRIKALLNISEISTNTLKTLNENQVFLNCSTSVRSQLRRAITLYNEYSSR